MSDKIDTRALLEELNSRGGGKNREKTKSDLTETQQADALLAHVAAFNNPQKFNISDFVRYRPERRAMTRNSEKLHIVVGFPEQPYVIGVTDENEGHATTYRRYDIFISLCDPSDKGCILTFAADSRDLELYPEGHRLKGAGSA